MKKAIAYSVLALGAWLAATTSWALVSYATGVPGPAAVTSGALGIGAEVIGAVDAPFPFSKAQRVAVRQLHRSQHIVERINSVPERAMRRFLGKLGIRPAHAHGVYATGVAPLPALQHRHVDRVRVRAPRIRVVLPNQERRISVEVATAMDEVRETLAAELSLAQAELLAAQADIEESWDHEAVQEELRQEFEALDLDAIRLEINAELEALAEELQRLQLNLDFELRDVDVDAKRADVHRFRLAVDAARETGAVTAPVADEVTD